MILLPYEEYQTESMPGKNKSHDALPVQIICKCLKLVNQKNYIFNLLSGLKGRN